MISLGVFRSWQVSNVRYRGPWHVSALLPAKFVRVSDIRGLKSRMCRAEVRLQEDPDPEVCARWISLLSFIGSITTLSAPVSGGSAALDMAPLSCGSRHVRLIAYLWVAIGSNAADAVNRVGITDTVSLDLKIQLVESFFHTCLC